ncbi:uncharacterized protein TRAVEDRAFT_53480 [Trametes versicolor FP-101664 SS1]|uniref:uncharacterized protein n=1 Tax=Trametes versicolor (strain FP-101664) TaxID=717944 RepID=UPI0004621C61|nr:uncharacterized protein TRAVEDRAFT_53480 [Trametes versicolor FP-101664 SS1]EIW53065.1 hypothetical protein TRAVEDRAFT_53480 [Trametes versicolor FP-101664 SS1]
MFGRATRGYIAIDARTRRFVFLKDSWRPFYKDVLQEGTYLERFAGDDQIIVPAIVCHGDVANQCTYTAQYQELSKRKKREAERLRILKEREEAASSTVAAEKKVNKRKRGRSVEAEGGDLFSDPSSLGYADLSEVTLRHHIHYRMVVKDVCLPFEMFRTTEQLIRLMSDCVATHHYVYEKHQLLHRDISAGNVLILPRLVKDQQGKEIVQWRGVLTDWELAKTYLVKRSDEKARQPERTGTWQFMSVAYVNSQWTQPISVADALESFFHVMIFFAIRFLPHTFSSPTKFVEQYFDTFWDLGNDVRECSLWKITAMRHGVFESGTEELEFLKTDRRQGNPFNALIGEILEPFKARYTILRYESRLAKQLLRSTANPPDSAAEAPVDDPTLPRFLSDVKDWRRPPISAAPVRKPTKLVPPTQEIRDLAALLDDHQWVLGLFADIRCPPMTEPSEWGGTWVVQDQLVGYEPRMLLMKKGATTQQTGTSGSRIGTDDGANKRPRNAGSNFASSSNQLPDTDSSLSVLSNAGTA